MAYIEHPVAILHHASKAAQKAHSMKKFLIALLLLTGCAQTPPIVIDPAFQPFVNQWNALYPSNSVNVSMQFADLSAYDAVGEWDGVQVWIDSTFWSTASIPEEQQVIFHELGHAEFSYGHDWYCITVGDISAVLNCIVTDSPWASEQDWGYVPRSIMYPYVFGENSFYLDPSWVTYYENQLSSCTTCTSPINGNGTSSDTKNQVRDAWRGKRID